MDSTSLIYRLRNIMKKIILSHLNNLKIKMNKMMRIKKKKMKRLLKLNNTMQA
jgi:hypothetical protein